MKVAELRKLVAGHSAEDLRALVVELYKALPKKRKEDEDLQGMLRRPGEIREIRKTRREPRRPDMGALIYDVESFLHAARNQLYFAPNRIIPKRERSKWRFRVKRFVKDLLAAAEAPEDLPEAARLLEELYGVLCTASTQWLFPSEDPFRAVGISQPDFLVHVLTLRQASEPPGDFVRRGLTLALESELDRATVHADLMVALLEHLKTPALRELALEECTIRRAALGEGPSRGTGRRGERPTGAPSTSGGNGPAAWPRWASAATWPWGSPRRRSSTSNTTGAGVRTRRSISSACWTSSRKPACRTDGAGSTTGPWRRGSSPGFSSSGGGAPGRSSGRRPGAVVISASSIP